MCRSTVTFRSGSKYEFLNKVPTKIIIFINKESNFKYFGSIVVDDKFDHINMIISLNLLFLCKAAIIIAQPATMQQRFSIFFLFFLNDDDLFHLTNLFIKLEFVTVMIINEWIITNTMSKCIINMLYQIFLFAI
jgi:hypothetical protein